MDGHFRPFLTNKTEIEKFQESEGKKNHVEKVSVKPIKVSKK